MKTTTWRNMWLDASRGEDGAHRRSFFKKI